MNTPTEVTTQVSVGTKIAVATLLLAGLGALGYASGYVKLDYNSSQAVSNAAAAQCDCLSECVQTRKVCIDSGRPVDECNGDLGACVDSCEPPKDEVKKDSRPPLNECGVECKNNFDSCIAKGGTQAECLENAASCMCVCDPTFAPKNIDNSCVDSCKVSITQCEDANAADPTRKVDCKIQGESCLNSCDLWCGDESNNKKGSSEMTNGDPHDSSATATQCESSCDVDYDQCVIDSATNSSLDCNGRRDGCLRECADEKKSSTTSTNGSGTNSDPNSDPNGDPNGTTTGSNGLTPGMTTGELDGTVGTDLE